MSLLLLLKGSATTAAPANTAAPTVSGTQRVGATLTAATGAWTNNPTGYTFQWQSATTIGGTYTNIGGATSQSYVLTSTELNKFVRVVVTATNAGGSGSANSDPVGAIQAALAAFTANLTAARPSILVDVDFSATLLGGSSSVWTDVKPYVREQLSVRRGRANALDKIEAGSGSTAVDNGDRRFEPEYASSPYYPNVLPMRGLRVRAVYNGTLYGLHLGYVQGWPLTWPGVKRARATISSTDGFDVLNAALLTDTAVYLTSGGGAGGGGITQTFLRYDPLLGAGISGDQINTILDRVGWPSTMRAIDAGTESMLGVSVDVSSPVSALEIIQNIADSEGGLFFFDGNGNAVFHDRDHRLVSARSSTVQAIFGDIGTVGAGELPYLVPETDFDVSRIYNQVTVASGLATPTTIPAVDSGSQTKYGPRTLSKSTILSSDSAALDQANRILNANKDPHLRFPTLTLDPTRDARLWPVVLGLEISDRVRVIRRPYAGGVAITKELWVEAIQHDIRLGQSFGWTTTLSLSLADPYSYWTLDSATKSILDSTTVLR